jgi:hypothetical protein
MPEISGEPDNLAKHLTSNAGLKSFWKKPASRQVIRQYRANALSGFWQNQLIDLGRKLRTDIPKEFKDIKSFICPSDEHLSAIAAGKPPLVDEELLKATVSAARPRRSKSVRPKTVRRKTS